MRGDQASHPAIPGELVTVLSPSRRLDLDLATGHDDVSNSSSLVAGSAVRIASVTKTFTAAAVLRLVELGHLRVTDTLRQAGVPADLLDLLTGDGYDIDAITVEQLLTHTSGIADFADNDSGVVSGPYEVAVLADPSRGWTRHDQVQFAVDHHDPLAAPGTEYHYSDTGYVLLGAILEVKTESSYGTALRHLLRFDKLGLSHTYLEDGVDQPARAAPRAHQYVGDVDAATITPTIDLYGGGGLVTTMHDLAVFYQALFSGHVFDRSATLVTMTTVAEAAQTEHGAMGVYRAAVGPATCWYHNGFWGVEVVSCPDLDITVARSWDQAVVDAFDSTQSLLAIVTRVVEVAS
jgi:D-alanyl-D-alanine carboxypeptidase